MAWHEFQIGAPGTFSLSVLLPSWHISSFSAFLPRISFVRHASSPVSARTSREAWIYQRIFLRFRSALEQASQQCSLFSGMTPTRGTDFPLRAMPDKVKQLLKQMPPSKQPRLLVPSLPCMAGGAALLLLAAHATRMICTRSHSAQEILRKSRVARYSLFASSRLPLAARCARHALPSLPRTVMPVCFPLVLRQTVLRAACLYIYKRLFSHGEASQA